MNYHPGVEMSTALEMARVVLTGSVFGDKFSCDFVFVFECVFV